MGLFSDKLFTTPIRNLVSLTPWNNDHYDIEAAGIGNLNDNNGLVVPNIDESNQKIISSSSSFSSSNSYNNIKQFKNPSTKINYQQNYFNRRKNDSNSNCHFNFDNNYSSDNLNNSMYLSCISSSRTPPSPSPPSPQFSQLQLSSSSNQQQQFLTTPTTAITTQPTILSDLIPLPYTNATKYYKKKQQTFSPQSTLSSSMSLSSPSDFIQIHSTNSKSCNNFDGHYFPKITTKTTTTPTITNYKNNIGISSDTIKNATSNYRIQQQKQHQQQQQQQQQQPQQTIKSKSRRHVFNRNYESSSRQKALKAVLEQLQTSLALVKNDVSHSDSIMSRTASNMQMTDITNIKSKEVVPFMFNNSERGGYEKLKLNRNSFSNNSSTGFSMKRNYFQSKTKFSNSSNSIVNDDFESGSAGMQQLSTSWEFIKLEEKPILDAVIKTSDDDKDEQQDVAPPRFIKISDGKISLGPPNISDNNKEKEILERRVLELESALQRVQDQLNHSQCGSPTLEKDLKEQLESMNRTIKSKERKAIQACRDHKALQARFSRQEAILQTLQHENKQLQQRVRQYEHCLDDVMRKVVDALVNEDSLREEVSMLKNRVKDLEAQNAALSASPAKGKDEGYCTMSSGQPQPSNSHLEDLPEEPEQWLLAAEPCSAEMEDWSMSQDELGVITLDDDGNEQEHDWIWNSSYLNSTMIDSQSEGISQLLRETIVYSDDEELTCTDFTRDFYKLVNIPSGSTRSLYSHMDAETDDEDDDDDDDEDEVEIEEIHSNDDKLIEHGQNNNNLSNNGSNNNTSSDKKLFSKMTKNKKSGPSPTPSEAGRALVTSCSSSESEGLPIQTTNSYIISNDICKIYPSYDNFDENHTPIVNNKVLRSEVQSSLIPLSSNKLKENSTPSTSNTSNLNSVWRKSNGWKRIATTSPKKEEQIIAKQSLSPLKKSKIPPPVPVRRSYAS